MNNIENLEKLFKIIEKACDKYHVEYGNVIAVMEYVANSEEFKELHSNN